MSDIRIPTALAQMDGFFGYKVLQGKTVDESANFSFRKKDFADWIFDIVFGLEKKEQPRAIALSAFKQIARQIEGTDNGEFKSLIDQYDTNNAPIDYNKIKKCLRTSLAYHPPRVYSRPASMRLGNPGIGSTRIEMNLEQMYLQNIRKSICNEDRVVQIFREGPLGVVTDANLESLANAMFLHYKAEKDEVEISEPSYYVNTRMELKQYEILKDRGAVFLQKSSTRVEILKFRLKLMEADKGISMEKVKSITKQQFKASKDFLKTLPASNY